MACGCVDAGCTCVIQGAGGIGVTGSGTSGNPFIISGVAVTGPTFAATSANGGITITPGGTAGHAPAFTLVLDPASEAPLSVSGTGLFVEETTFSATAGPGIAITPGGPFGHTPDFELVLDPASPAPLSVSIDGLSVDCCGGGLPDVEVLIVDTVVADTDNHTYLVDTGAAPITVTLPLVPGSNQRIDIKNFGQTPGNTVTVDPNGNFVDHAVGTYLLGDYDSDSLVWEASTSSWARL